MTPNATQASSGDDTQAGARHFPCLSKLHPCSRGLAFAFDKNKLWTFRHVTCTLPALGHPCPWPWLHPLLLLVLELLQLCSPTVSTCHCRSRCSPDTTLASTFPSGTPTQSWYSNPYWLSACFPAGLLPSPGTHLTADLARPVLPGGTPASGPVLNPNWPPLSHLSATPTAATGCPSTASTVPLSAGFFGSP